MADIEVPEWLTADFLKTCLESDVENFPEVKVTNFKIEQAVPAGNNYGSNMLRVKIHFKTTASNSTAQVLSLIVKAPLTTGLMKKFSEMSSTINEREPRYYNEFITETYKLCKHDIVPKHYISPFSNCLVMEDLKASGYKMVDRKKLLDLDHSKIYTQASAKLHALSVAVYKTNPERLECIVNEEPGFVQALEIIYKPMIRKGALCMEAYLEDKPEFEEFWQIFKDLAKDDMLWKLYKEAQNSAIKKPLRAVVQTDPWYTNMMFKYDNNGKITGIKLLDFQTTRFMSPVFEIVSFLWFSMKPEVRKDEQQNIFKLYCETLNNNLAELGCSERLSLEDLKSQAFEFSPIVMTIVCAFIPFILAEDGADIDDFMTFSKENIKSTDLYKMYQNPTIIEMYPKIFKELRETGILDYIRKQIQQIQ